MRNSSRLRHWSECRQWFTVGTMITHQQPFTLRAAAGAPSDLPSFSDAALILIDVQAEYEVTGSLSLPDHDAATAKISMVLNQARVAGGQVLHVAHRGSAGGLFDPAAGGRISEEAQPAVGEPTIHKTLPNAFAGTDLDSRLRTSGTTHLVLVGFMTHMCISSTARAALDLGYATTVISDASATRDLPSAQDGSTVEAAVIHNSALAELADRFSNVATTQELLSVQSADPVLQR